MKQLIPWLIIFLPLLSSAQRVLQQIDYVEAGFFIHSVGVSFSGDDFFSLNHLPGLFASTGIPIRVRDKWGMHYKLMLAGYHQKDLHYGFQLDNQVVQSFKVSDELSIEAPLGLGYLHTFEDASIYRFNGTQYKQKRDWGRTQFTLSIGLGVAARLGRNARHSVFIQQQLVFQFPYAANSGIAVLSHSRTYFGIRRYINTGQNE